MMHCRQHARPDALTHARIAHDARTYGRTTRKHNASAEHIGGGGIKIPMQQNTHETTRNGQVNFYRVTPFMQMRTVPYMPLCD